MTTEETRPRPPSPRARRWDVISFLLGALPGVLLGAYVTGLLFFLNPELPQTPAAVLRGLVLYGYLFGTATAVLCLPFIGRARALLPWSLTLALAVSAVSTWAHASWASYYLPPGVNIRLIKAAVLLSVAAAIACLTALMHSIDRRGYGRRSRLLLGLLCVAVLYVMVERRSAFDPPPPVAPLPSETSYRNRPALWVVGLEGATLDAILPLAEQGYLPFFSNLLAHGVSARLESQAPPLETVLWTTVATGRHPYHHRIVGDEIYPGGVLSSRYPLRLTPPGYRWWGFLGGQAQPVDASQRQHLVLWEMLSRLDIPAGVVGWPLASPTRQPVAYAFSDRYFRGDLSAATARPSELAARGALFRLDPEDVDAEMLGDLGTTPPYPFLRAVASDQWRESLTEFLLDQRPEVDGLFLRLEGLEEVSRRYYGGFAGVQFDGAQDARRQDAARLIAAYYRYLDRLLARLAARAGAERRVLAVVSPCGFSERRGWRRLTALTTESSLVGSRAGAPDGMLLLSGPGIPAARRLPDADLVDILPTLLYSVGLPIARDLDGRVLTAAFDSAFLASQPLTFIPSYETLAIEDAPPPGPELMVGAVAEP